MIKAVLFDLDDTLVEINLGVFAGKYIWGLSKVMGSIARRSTIETGMAYARAYLHMESQERTDTLTNRELLDQELSRALSIRADDPAVRDAIDCYERERLPRMREGLVMARPRPGAREALETCRSLGLKVALATNPAFSLAVDEVRLAWAGLSDFKFDAITTLDNSCRLKPSARYYRDLARTLGLMPEECLMVGNDASRDFPRPDIGIQTCYVGHGKPSRPAAWAGPIAELADYLPYIIDVADTQADARQASPDGGSES